MPQEKIVFKWDVQVENIKGQDVAFVHYKNTMDGPEYTFKVDGSNTVISEHGSTWGGGGTSKAVSPEVAKMLNEVIATLKDHGQKQKNGVITIPDSDKVKEPAIAFLSDLSDYLADNAISPAEQNKLVLDKGRITGSNPYT